MKKYLLLLFCFPLFMSACSDDDSDTPSPEEMLMNKQWQIAALTVASPLGSIDYYESFEDCQRDNYVEFRSGGVLIFDEGAMKCNTSAPQQTQGTWSLEGDVLTVSGMAEGLSIPFDELELTVTDQSETSISSDFGITYSGFSFTGSMTLETR